MTTDSPKLARDPGATAIAGAAVGSCAAAAVVVLAALTLGAGDAVSSALVGGVSTAVAMAFGAYVVHVAAHALPSASLMVAILTYALQVISLTAFFALLARSAETAHVVRSPWLVAGVTGGVLGWVVAQIWFATRARIPLYDLPAAPQGGAAPGDGRRVNEH